MWRTLPLAQLPWVNTPPAGGALWSGRTWRRGRSEDWSVGLSWSPRCPWGSAVPFRLNLYTADAGGPRSTTESEGASNEPEPGTPARPARLRDRRRPWHRRSAGSSAPLSRDRRSKPRGSPSRPRSTCARRAERNVNLGRLGLDIDLDLWVRLRLGCGRPPRDEEEEVEDGDREACIQPEVARDAEDEREVIRVFHGPGANDNLREEIVEAPGS